MGGDSGTPTPRGGLRWGFGPSIPAVVLQGLAMLCHQPGTDPSVAPWGQAWGASPQHQSPQPGSQPSSGSGLWDGDKALVAVPSVGTQQGIKGVTDGVGEGNQRAAGRGLSQGWRGEERHGLES